MQKVKMMKKYADLIAEAGLDAGPKKDVAIYAEVEMYEFVRYLVAELYKYRVKHIAVHHTDQSLLRQALINTPDSRFPLIAQEGLQALKDEAAKGFDRLLLCGAGLETVKRLPLARSRLFAEAKANAESPWLMRYEQGSLASCTAVVPTKNWAKELYPELTPSQSYTKLWEQIYAVCRIDTAGNPALNYQRHLAQLAGKAAALNKLHFQSLVLSSATTGTKLTLTLPIKHIWRYGVAEDAKGLHFLPAIPVEGVYTSPHSHGTNGIVYGTRALLSQGERIEGFWLRFEGGKVVDFGAKTGLEALRSLIFYDDFSFRLGVVSLIEEPTVLGRAETVFGNALLDSESSSMVALGNSLAQCFENGTAMDPTQLRSHGLNRSRIQLNLPIGAADLQAEGETEDHRRIVVFAGGKWQL